tara:strand:- start:252 stop:881 length:630 start_codon:yes stop_codon:yes gene_type:complete
MRSQAINSILNQIRAAQASTSSEKQNQFDLSQVATQGPGGELKVANLLFDLELPRVSRIVSSLEKQAMMGSSDSEYLLAMAHLMREKIASEAAAIIKQAGKGCGCSDCSGPEDIADKLLDYSLKMAGVKKKYQSADGGLNRKGRAHFKRTEGANLKRPVSKKQAKKSPKSAKRRKSFCARMGGMKKKHNIDCSKTPDKSICKALRKWDC